MQNNLKIVIIIVLLGYFGISSVTAASITYKSYVDPGYGFYKIRTTPNTNISYNITSKILNINQGDTVTWINDADNAGSLSITSNQNLWTGTAVLEKSYTFNNPGTYTFTLKEYNVKQQTIIVSGTSAVVQTVTPIATPVPTTPAPTINPTTSRPTPIPTTPAPTLIQTPRPTPIPTIDLLTFTPTATPQVTYTPTTTAVYSSSVKVEEPYSIPPTMISSIGVGILSIYITRKIGNKK